MWTYLAIILGFGVLLGVFLFRTNFVLQGKDRQETKESEDFEDDFKDIEHNISKQDENEAEELYQEGKNLLDHRKEDEAMKSFINCLALNPQHHEAQHDLAMIYMQKQMYGPASTLFKQLAELTSDAKHFSHLGLALFQQSDYDGAKSAYQKAVAADQERPERFINLSQVYRQLKQPILAEIALVKALDQDPKNPHFLLYKADFLFENEKIEEAKETINKILDYQPDFAEAKALLKEIKKSLE